MVGDSQGTLGSDTGMSDSSPLTKAGQSGVGKVGGGQDSMLTLSRSPRLQPQKGGKTPALCLVSCPREEYGSWRGKKTGDLRKNSRCLVFSYLIFGP